MPIKLSPDQRKQLQASIQRYVAENLDEEIGDLKAGLLLEFCVTEIGAVVYNQAIADAQAYFQERAGDLDGVCHENEFTYWQKSGKGTA
ncbi:MAG TPA: DUF2164 domain-containing protein [Vicinamibacterales bacterium]|nr:DUF2164 domain-containing protein [Vicinamibacterales bacterium]